MPMSSAGEDRGVVDAVAHEGQILLGPLLGDELLDLVHLVAGQQARMVLIEAQLCRDGLRHRLGVAGQHDRLADAGLLEALDGLCTVGLHHIGR